MDSPGKNTRVGCCALPPRDLPDPRIEPESLMSPALAGGFFTTSTTWEAHEKWHQCQKTSKRVLELAKTSQRTSSFYV